jgi:hypothetical protein
MSIKRKCKDYLSALLRSRKYSSLLVIVVVVAGIGTYALVRSLAASDPCADTNNTLASGCTLTPGESRDSSRANSTSYRAVMQGNGNFELFNPDGKLIWKNLCSGTSTGAYIGMRTTGNLVEYNASGKDILWSSHTSGNGNKLVMESTGVLSIVTTGGRVVWSTASNSTCSIITSPPAAPGSPPTAGSLTIGVQDGSIDACDGETPGSSWSSLPTGTSATYSQITRTTTDTADGGGILDTNFAGLHVKYVRVTVPWDIAYRPNGTGPDDTAGNNELNTAQACFNYWLTVMQQQDLTPNVSFRPDYNYVSNGSTAPAIGSNSDGTGKILIPNIDTYNAAMVDFFKEYNDNLCGSSPPGAPNACPLAPLPAGVTQQYPAPAPANPSQLMANVNIVAPWGEPDFESSSPAGLYNLRQTFYLQSSGSALTPATPSVIFSSYTCKTNASNDRSTNCGPTLAADMYAGVASQCTNCTVFAGDFASVTSNVALNDYLDLYNYELIHHDQVQEPTNWAIHPYTDITAYEKSVEDDTTKPKDATTLAYKYSADLGGLGYKSSNTKSSNTNIWFDEITSKASVCNNNSDPCNSTTNFSIAAQTGGANYLIDYLAAPGVATPPGDPEVAGFYYLKYTDTNGALVSSTDTLEPAYSVIAAANAPIQ